MSRPSRTTGRATRARALGLATLGLALAACEPEVPPLTTLTDEAAALYPDLFSVYAADHGIYRGCGPTNGVCHNGNEYPNLSSLGSIVDSIGRGCNQKRGDATTVHDLCERPGDRLVTSAGAAEIAWIDELERPVPALPASGEPPAGAPDRVFRARLREPLAGVDGAVIARDGVDLFALGDLGIRVAGDPEDPAGTTVLFSVARRAAAEGAEEIDPALLLARAGVPGDPAAIAVGDPNRNGTFGAEQNGRIIAPGDPARSYLFTRLVDPAAGPLMPRANCCKWTKEALRALYCWIDGLEEDGSNAMAPINYARCSAGPSVDLLYPEPGPGCETAGRCPVEAADVGADAPTFHNVYARVLVPSCGGALCHVGGTAMDIDFATERRAFESLRDRVVPGDPNGSRFYQRLDPTLCAAPSCRTMPLGRAPLTADKLALIRAWIEMGATP